MNTPLVIARRGKALFHHRPMVVAALGLCAGIEMGRFGGMPVALALAAGLCLCGLLAQRLQMRRFTVLLVCMGLGICRMQLTGPVRTEVYEQALLRGRICETPVREGNGWQLMLSRAELMGRPVPGRVQLKLYDAALPAAYGQWVEATAAVAPGQQARNDGGFDQRMYDRSRGVVYRASADTALLFHGASDLYGTLLRLREWITETLDTLYGPINGPLATGMLLGDKRALSADILADFRDSGIAHLLAVSGLHVGVLTAALLFLLRRRRAGLQLGITAAFLLFYCALSAFSASTLRASMMAFCLLSARVLHRRSDPLSALSFAACLILLWNPFQLYAAGFLLSFSAVLGILLLYPPLHACCARLPKPMADGFCVSLAAQLGIMGPTAALFGRVPLMTLFANLLVTPLCALALIPALLALPLYAIFAPLGRAVGQVGGVVLSLMRAVATLAARPGALDLAAPSRIACLVLLLAFAFFSRYCLAALRRRLMLGGLCAILSLFLWILPGRLLPGSHVTVLDTGRGYALHLRTPQGDVLTGSQAGLASSALTGYRRFHGLPAPAGEPLPANGAVVAFGPYSLALSQGVVQVDHASYDLGQTGQLRFFIGRDGRLRARAYVRSGGSSP